MKKTTLLLMLALSAAFLKLKAQQTELRQTDEKFANGEAVWGLINSQSGQDIGEFWPIKALELYTNQTDSKALANPDLETMVKNIPGAVAAVPAGLSAGSPGNYTLLGRSLAHKGTVCGNDSTYSYGIFILDSRGCTFTHMSEISNFDSFYSAEQAASGIMLFLPVIYREGKFISSQKRVDKVLIRRETPGNIKQYGVVLFDNPITYDEARQAILGLDRPGKSKTTHIYILAGGKEYGQSCKITDKGTHTIGTRDPKKVTNYFILY